MSLNKHGVKESSDCYRTIGGVKYYIWIDGHSKEDCEKIMKDDKVEYPKYDFKLRKVGDNWAVLYHDPDVFEVSPLIKILTEPK